MIETKKSQIKIEFLEKLKPSISTASAGKQKTAMQLRSLDFELFTAKRTVAIKRAKQMSLTFGY